MDKFVVFPAIFGETRSLPSITACSAARCGAWPRAHTRAAPRSRWRVDSSLFALDMNCKICSSALNTNNSAFRGNVCSNILKCNAAIFLP